MQSAVHLDSLLALSARPSAAAAAIDTSASERCTSSPSPSSSTLDDSLLDLDFTSFLTTATMNHSNSNGNGGSIATATPAAAPSAAAAGKENAVNAGTSKGSSGKTGKTPGGKTKECTACHVPKSRPEYSASQWKKKGAANAKNSNSANTITTGGRRCIDCIAAGDAQAKAVMAAAVVVGTVGAVCASTGTDPVGASGSSKNEKSPFRKLKALSPLSKMNKPQQQQGLAERLPKENEDENEAAATSEAEAANVNDDDGVGIGDNDNEEEVLADDEEEDLTLTNFDSSLLTLERTPTKTNEAEATMSSNYTAIAVIAEEEAQGDANANAAAFVSPVQVTAATAAATATLTAMVVEGLRPTPRAANGELFAGFSPVQVNGSIAAAPADDVGTNENSTNDDINDEALTSTYSFSLYEAEVSLEHIKSPPTLPAKDTLTVATDALALPCFKSDVLRELTTNTCAKAETSFDVCSPTVNSMASMFATHATATAFGFDSPDPSTTRPTASTSGSPLRLTGIDVRHLSDVYTQLHVAAAQSELALDDAASALVRIESILLTQQSSSSAVTVESENNADGDSSNTSGAEPAVINIAPSGILELGMVLSDAFWVIGDASKADAVRQVLSDYIQESNSASNKSDEADMAATGMQGAGHCENASVEELVAALLQIMHPPPTDEEKEEDIELDAIEEEEEKTDDEQEELVAHPTIAITKHVHFDTDREELPRSPVADELNDLSDRKIASSILKGGGYPTKNDTEVVDEELVAENLSSAIVEIQPSSRPDVIQHIYHNYRSAYECGKEHIPLGGSLLSLAEFTASTSIRIASLGQLDLQAVDEGLIGPHIVKGLDDIVINPVLETVGGVANGVGGAVGAVVSVLPFVGGGGGEQSINEE